LIVALVLCSSGKTADDAKSATPAYFRRLIDAGDVTIEFYDRRADPVPYRGYTEFQLNIRHEFSYRYQWVQQGRTRRVTIEPRLRKVSSSLTHSMRLPKYLDSDRRWNDPLVKHEFDHVALSCDPRVMMLAEHLLGGVRKIVRTLPDGTTIDDSLVRKLVEEELAKRVEATVELVKANQRLLDEVTRHGARRLPDREAFFRALFTRPNLDRAKFPYTDEALELLQSEDYRKTKLPYAFRE
jgi:hypothetical protein